MPLMHTETKVLDEDASPAWLWKQWMNVLRLRQKRIPVLGFTWFSLIDQLDWDVALAEKRVRLTVVVYLIWIAARTQSQKNIAH
jgi:hypothetical protein